MKSVSFCANGNCANGNCADGKGDAGVIALQNLCRRYGDQPALDSLNLSVGAGEFFSLLGPSGCGKTTTLRLIAGFDRPDRGRVLLQGRDLTDAPPHRRPVNLVFQNYALFPHLSVWDNVAFGPRSLRLADAEVRRRVGEALEVVRLADLARRRPHQLSGGQQQRVALARALVNAPAALLLDEPLAALDPDLRRTMRAELQRIQRQVGTTFVLVTHDREEALSLSDRLAVLHEGRLEQVGTPRQLYDCPRSAVVATFLGAANLLPDATGAGLRLLRPERLRLRSSAPREGERGLRARVRELVFQGATVEVRLRTERDQALVAIDTAAAVPNNLRVGSEFWCCWNPADSHLLEEPA
ncbi:MAG: ABC transporter ATP-binding protein [Synechococcaceae cyanobacterium]|nr:ABC transporter ATP-binding protein [Synechococcaceae cyanobacterium]